MRFSHPTRSAEDQITIWCEQLDSEFRLVQRLPGGHLSAERFGDRTALLDATVRLQTELTGAGWRPAPGPSPRSRPARAGHFHR